MKPPTPPESVLEAPIRIDSHLDRGEQRSLAEDVLDGLTRPFKELPPKHFYDSRGAELFDQICELPEYYPTRAERAILQEEADEIARLTRAAEIAGLLGPEDHLLMGTDLVKDPDVLEAAYDDAQGVTAEFNRNVLRVVNRELDAGFDPEDFDHVAHFNREHEWIEMRLRARREHTTLVRALDLPVHFDAREEMRTEISAKFTPQRLQGDLAAAGLELTRWLTDSEGLFALSLSCLAAD